MRLYHYIAKGNDAPTRGILSIAENPNADISYYLKRSGETTHAGVVRWMESCFEGRSRTVRGFSEPIKWHERSLSLKRFVENADLFAIDASAMERDGLIDAVYKSPAVIVKNADDAASLPRDVDEELVRLGSVADIDTAPVDWAPCNDDLGLRFAVVPYYLLIVRGGIVPPDYISLVTPS